MPGGSPAVVQDIIGHDSAEMSAHYTHIESGAKRQALAALLDLEAPLQEASVMGH